MKLYSLPGACSTADHIVLQWSGLAFTVEINKRDEASRAALRAVNPSGTVPVLTDGDFVLTQNSAILGYISDNAPDANLLGDGTARQRAEAMRWLMYSNADLQPAFEAFFAPQMLIDEPGQHEAVKASARRRLRSAFGRANERLASHPWLAGFRSVADAHFYIMLRWARMFDVDLQGMPHLAAFIARMEADTGVKAALAAEGLA